jgi:putative ABC transport system substrate-binding protein
MNVRRRDFITLLGGAGAAWPRAARAQQPKVPTIGFLGRTTPAAETQRLSAFVQRPRDRGWTEGRSVAIEVRWAEGRTERYTEIAAEFARMRVDVIVTAGTPSVIATRRAAPRLCNGDRPGRQRACRELGATRRQCHRPVDPRD